MIIEIYKEYFATEHQKNVIDDILNHNQMLVEKQKEIDYYKKYDNNQFITNNSESNEQEKEKEKKIEENNNEEQSLIVHNESFLVKLKRFIFKIFHIEEK